ncbi:MAG: hypothetical protein DWQ06_04835 [Calditrichaeota bacterium]|nr:MAG: hypothetical protein DWQ06_04835 [Calditrichota bacterium]
MNQKGKKMNRKNKIENEVKKTLSLLDEKEFLEHNEHFYTVLQAKINRLEDEKKVAVLKPKNSVGILRPAFLSLMFVANLVTFFFVAQNSESQDTETENLSGLFAQEYSLTNENTDILNSFQVE